MRPFGRFRGLGPTCTMTKAAAEAEREDAQKAKEAVDPEAPEQPASSPAEAEDISISLMRKMVLRFEEQKWVGAVQISGTFSTPLSDSTFYIKALFGKVSTTIERTEVKAPTKQAAEPKSMKWWTRKLDEKLSFLEKKAKSLAFMFHSFEIRGRCGIVFNLGLQTPAVTVGFQVTVELTVDCLLASLEEGQDGALAKEIAEHKQKAKEKRAEKRPVRRLAKRIEERKAKRRGDDDDADQSREKDKDDAALEKMVLSVQAIKMKFESLAWYGLVTVKIGLGLMSFYVQVTTYRTQFGAQVETENAAAAAEVASDRQLSEDKHEESQLAEEVVELVDGEDVDAGSAVARAVESSDAKKKGKRGAFGKGLNKAINRIKAASDAGFCGVQAGASFSFYVFGFGLEVDLYIDAAKVESNMGW